MLLDLAKAYTPPFSTKLVIDDIAELLSPYHIKKVYGDRHGQGYIESAFLDAGLKYKTVDAQHSASNNFLQAEKVINAGVVSLLDNAELLREFRILDRVRSLTGDRVDHPRGTHDDLAAAVSGALVYAREAARVPASKMQVRSITLSTNPAHGSRADVQRFDGATPPWERDVVGAGAWWQDRA